MTGNHKSIVQAVAIYVVLLAPLSADAQIANDRENFYGDRLRISVDVKATSSDDKPVCIPGGTSMVVVGQDDKSLYVKLDVGPKAKGCGTTESLTDATAYVIALEDLKKSGVARTGITFGALVVPFKYQTSGKKDFTGSATLGGYLGYRFETLRNLGITATPIVFMGASNISVPSTAAATSENVMGFSYGLGLVGTFKSSFQAGVVVGWDRVGKSVGYQYNGKPWVALEIGFAFLQ